MSIRNLLKNKVYSALIIGGFSIGFAACLLIALFYNAEHNIDTHFPNYNNIYRIYDAKNNDCNFDYKLLQPLSENYPEIKKVCPMEYSSYFQLTIKDTETHDFIREKQIVVTNNSFFDLFSINIISKLSNKPFKDKNSVVVSESFAKKLFGNKDPLGRTIKEEFFTATVTAVMKDIPDNSSFKANLLLNSENDEFRMSQICENGYCYYPTTFFVLLENNTKASDFANSLNISHIYTKSNSLELEPLTDIYLSSLPLMDEHAKGNSKLLIVFISIAILILLLSSINYLNYSISMQYAKMKDIGISKVNGANWKQLATNSFVEVAIGIILSLIIALALTSLLLPYTGILFGRTIVLSDINYLQFLPIFILTIIAIIFLNSLAPIYLLSRFNISDFLSGGRRKSGKQIGKQTLLIFQLTVSIVLIAIVMLIFKQLQFVKNSNLGFETEHLVRLELPYKYPNPSIIKNEMAKLAFVSNDALSDGYPGNIKVSMGSGEEDKHFMIECIYVSDDFLETMNIKLLDGRDFLQSDNNKACLMNKAAIDKFGWDSFQGKKFKNGTKEGFSVIGELKNFNIESLHKEIKPVAILYNPDHPFSTLSLRLTPGNINDQINQILKKWKSLLPYDPLDLTFYDQQFQAMYNKEEKLAKSITFFTIVAIALTCMGLLGQFFLTTLNRTKEIGIRKVNGATAFEILIMLNKNLIIWIIISFVIATPIAYYIINQWLQNFAYKTPLGWWIFALSGIIVLLIELITVSLLSWQAASRNPVEALRYE